MSSNKGRENCAYYSEEIVEPMRKGQKLFLWGVLILGLIIVSLGLSTAAECNATIGLPTITSCTVSQNLTLDKGTYLYNGTSNGLILVNGSNLILDGAGSTLKGNFTAGAASFLAGIRVNGANVTIKNFIIHDYYYNIFLPDGANNVNITNNTFLRGNRLLRINSNYSWVHGNLFSLSTSGAELYMSPGSHAIIINNTFNHTISAPNVETFGLVNNLTFIRNFFNASHQDHILAITSDASGFGRNIFLFNNSFETNKLWGVNLNNVSGAIVYGNKITGSGIQGLIQINANSTDINISYNDLIGNNTLFSEGVVIDNTANNILINKNNISNTHYTIYTESTSLNIKISSNYFFNNDIGTRLGGTLQHFENNIADYPVNGSIDGYWIPLKLIGCTNCKVSGNIFQNLSQGFITQNSTNLTINQNNFKFMSFSQRQGYVFSNNRMGQCAINTIEVYTSWIGEGNEVNTEDNITHLSKFATHNVSISGNTFDANTQCYLHAEGTTGITHDFSNYWYRKFQTPTYLINASEFYLNSNFNNYTWMSPTIINDTLYSTYFGTSVPKMIYQINKDYLFFGNINKTQIYDTNLYNLNNALIYYSNFTVMCSSGNCGANYDLSLRPYNSSYVLDNFNLTEGTSRQFSPLWFSSSTSTQKVISSNLSEAINATTVVSSSTITCTNVQATYKGVSVTPTSCANNVFTFSLSDIPPGESSLLLNAQFEPDLEDACRNSISGLGEFGNWVAMILIALGIMVVLGLIYSGKLEGDALIGGISMMVIVIVFVIFGVLIVNALC